MATVAVAWTPIAMPTPQARLSPSLIDRLSARADVHQVPEATVLFEEGDAADTVYILLTGQVKVFSKCDGKREVIYNVVGPGVGQFQMEI